MTVTTDDDQATTLESSQQQNGGQSAPNNVDEQQLQNGAPSAAEGDVGQLINLDDDGEYRVEVRQQTEQTSHTTEHVQQDGTDEVRCVEWLNRQKLAGEGGGLKFLPSFLDLLKCWVQWLSALRINSF